MFGIGIPEMLMILGVALIVVGPKKLPELARTMGSALGELKRTTRDLTENIKNETGLNEVEENLKTVGSDMRKSLGLDIHRSPNGKRMAMRKQSTTINPETERQLPPSDNDENSACTESRKLAAVPVPGSSR